MKLVDKEKIVAEIERLQGVLQDPAMNRESMQDYAHGGNKIINEIRSFIDSLEVKEMDLEKHLKGETELLKVKGFLVRDKDDYTAIYAEKPHRGKTEWVNGNGSCLMTINDARLVPDIEFEDEPVEVEVTLKRV